MTDTSVQIDGWVVQVLRKWSSIQVLGIPLDSEAAAPGCIGFIPVFKTLEQAQAWRLENNHELAKIVPIAAGPES